MSKKFLSVFANEWSAAEQTEFRSDIGVTAFYSTVTKGAHNASAPTVQTPSTFDSNASNLLPFLVTTDAGFTYCWNKNTSSWARLVSYSQLASVALSGDSDDLTEGATNLLLTAAERSAISANTAKVTNATHTGDATGDTALTLQPAAITGKTSKATVVGADTFLISDSADSGNLKEATLSSLKGLIRTVTVDPADSYTPTNREVILHDVSAGAKTVNLPAAASSTNFEVVIKKTDSSANAVTIDANAAEEIDGTTTQEITIQYHSLTLICDGSNWYII